MAIFNTVYGGGPKLKLIFDFTTSDLHGFTNKTTDGAGLVIDTTNHWCTRGNSNWSNGAIYKSVNYTYCWQRIKGNFNYASGVGGMLVGIGNWFLGSSNGFGGGINNGNPFMMRPDSGDYTGTAPAGWSRNTDYYYDLIFENGTLTLKILDTSLNELYTHSEATGKTAVDNIGFCMWSGSTSQGQSYIKEYWLDYS